MIRYKIYMSFSSHDGVCDETKSLAEAPAGRATTWAKARSGGSARRPAMEGETDRVVGRSSRLRPFPRERGQHAVAVAGAELVRDSIDLREPLPTKFSTPRVLVACR